MKLVPVLVLTLGFAACSVTQQAPLQSASRSGLVDYSRMTAGGEGQAAMRYVNPNAQWRTYTKIVISPVTYWAAHDGSGISASDEQALCNFTAQALQQQLAKKFTVASEPGPGTMRLQVALMDASGATPVLRSVSMLIPQARVLATLKFVATGSYPFIGGAQVEAKLTDAATGQVLGEWADRRLGGGSMATAAQWQWGDAENAINAWAEQAATRLSSWTSGTAAP
jgi:hypothetical protein